MSEKVSGSLEEKLDQILRRLDRVEASIAKVEAGLEMVPMATGALADMVDTSLQGAMANGMDPDQRFRDGMVLLKRLYEPKTVMGLHQLLDLLETLPDGLAMLVDIADSYYVQARSSGVDLDITMKNLGNITRLLSQPGLTEMLKSVLQLGNDFPKILATLVDSFDELYKEAAAQGIEPEALLEQGAETFGKFAGLLASKEFKSLLESGVLDPESVAIVGAAGKALVESKSSPSRKIGLFGMIRELKDANMQHSVGFLTAVAKNFGQYLSQTNSTQNKN